MKSRRTTHSRTGLRHRPARAAAQLILAGAVLAISASTSWAAPQGASRTEADLHGVWWNDHPETALHPSDGKQIPFTAKGKDLYAQSAAEFKAKAAKPVERNDLDRCMPLGPTRILNQPFPLQIVQKPGIFVLVYEHNHVYEYIYFNEKPDPDRDPAFMGNSVGNWITGGISITSTNFKDGSYLDDTGLPHSDQLTVVRTFRKIDAGKRLEIITTITDPVVFAKPWAVRNVLEYRPDAQIEEYTCGQGPTLETRYTRREALQR